jgi:hypothetical protein
MRCCGGVYNSGTEGKGNGAECLDRVTLLEVDRGGRMLFVSCGNHQATQALYTIYKPGLSPVVPGQPYGWCNLLCTCMLKGLWLMPRTET